MARMVGSWTGPLTPRREGRTTAVAHHAGEGTGSAPPKRGGAGEGRTLYTGARLVGFLAVAHLVVDAVSATVPALLPTLQAMFGLGETALASLISLGWLTSSSAQPVLGTLADRYGPRRVGAAGLGVSVTVTSLLAVAPQVWMLYAAVALGGLGSAAFHPAASALVRGHGLAGRAGLGVSLYGAAGTAGIALGPVAVLVLIGTVGSQAAPALMFPGLVFALVMVWRAPDIPAERRGSPALDLGLLRGPVGRLALAALLSALPAVTLTSSLPLLLVAGGSAPDDPLIGLSLAVFSLASAAGAVVAALLSARVPRQRIAAASMMLAVPALTAVVASAPGGTAGPSGVYIPALVAAGALCQAALPLLTVAAQDAAPLRTSAAAGTVAGWGVGGAGVLYLAVGALQEAVGVRAAAAVVVITLVPAAWLAHRTLAAVPVVSSVGLPDALSGHCGCQVCECATTCPTARSASS